MKEKTNWEILETIDLKEVVKEFNECSEEGYRRVLLLHNLISTLCSLLEITRLEFREITEYIDGDYHIYGKNFTRGLKEALDYEKIEEIRTKARKELYNETVKLFQEKR